MKNLKWKVFGIFCLIAVGGLNQSIAEDKIIRIGMIGLDTSHATHFTAILNDPNNDKGHVPGGKVVAGVKQFSPDIESSASKVDAYVELPVSYTHLTLPTN